MVNIISEQWVQLPSGPLSPGTESRTKIVKKKTSTRGNVLTTADVATCDQINKVQQETDNCDVTTCSGMLTRIHTQSFTLFPTHYTHNLFLQICLCEGMISSLPNFAFDLWIFILQLSLSRSSTLPEFRLSTVIVTSHLFKVWYKFRCDGKEKKHTSVKMQKKNKKNPLSLPKAVVSSTDESAENPYLFMEKTRWWQLLKKIFFSAAAKEPNKLV